MNSIEHGERLVLHSWKEISSYLGFAIRTMQRYERQFGLPVHRPARTLRTSVIAFADELDAWLTQAPLRRNYSSEGDVCPLCSGSGMVAPAGIASTGRAA